MLKVDLHPYQEEAVDRAVERRSLLIAYEMGLGKEQPVSEPVLTPSGWSTMGELREGDYVIGKDGNPTKVLGVYPQGTKDVYRVTFNDGSSTRAGAEHLWEVRTNNDFHRGTHRVMTTQGILEHGVRDGAGNRRYRIPVVDPVQFPERNLPLDPYLLGVLIGDGGITRQVLFSSADAELVAEVESRIPYGVSVKYLDRYDYKILGDVWGVNPVTEALKDLGLMYHGAHEKFIPQEYLLGSVEQRTLLLQGLMDTDGHVRPKDGNIEFVTVSKRLAEDVVSLVRSLGGVTKIREKPTKGRLAYRMSLNLPEQIRPFRLGRKADVVQARTKYHPTRLIDSIELEGREESVCIYVEADDHLYVTKDYVVTHNTVIALAAVEELLALEEVETTVIVVPASLKYQWAKQIAKLTDVPTRVIKVREDGETQEITVPTEEYCVLIDGDPKKRAAQYMKIKAHRPDYVVMSYESVVNDWQYVRRIKPECLVLDEVTAIKTFKAQRTRKIKRLTAPFRYGLTGTPVENGKPEELFSIMQWVDDEVLGRFDLYDKTYIVRNRFGGVQHYKNLPVLHAKLSSAMVRKTRMDDDVRPYLPAVQESNIPVTLDARTKKAYKRIADDLLAELRAAGPSMGEFDLFAHYHGGETPNENSQQGKIMARMQALDMLLNHPDLIAESGRRYEESELARQRGVQKKTWPGSKYCYEVWQSGLLDDVTTSPKLDAVVAVVEDILAVPGNKAIIFSVNPDMLDLIADRLPEGCSVTYTGRMSGAAKAYAAQRFEVDPECRVFLSSHAGAFGTDLYMANYLINYDLAWSSGKQDQINARHNRASSQFKHIYILNAITAGTTEPRKLAMLAHKRRVGSAITDGRGADEKGRVENDLVTLTQCLELAA